MSCAAEIDSAGALGGFDDGARIAWVGPSDKVTPILRTSWMWGRLAPMQLRMFGTVRGASSSSKAGDHSSGDAAIGTRSNSLFGSRRRQGPPASRPIEI